MSTTLYRGGRLHASGATALLVDGDTVVWVGDGPQQADRTVELHGAWVAPAFVDAHVHATSTGLALTGLDLTGAPSLRHALDAVERAARASRGRVLLGTGWDETRWPEGRPPTSSELDRASYGGVVYLARTDVHSAVASSALLALCPDARSAPGWAGNGLVRQQAHHVVRRTALSAITPAQQEAAQRAALDRAASLGIGQVHECAGPDISSVEDARGLMSLDHVVERVLYWGEVDALDTVRELGARGAAGDLFVDGAVGSRTACLHDSYLDGDGTGHAYLDADQVRDHVVACTQAGLQAGFHAIGDAAVQAVVHGLSAAADKLGKAAVRAARHRVEHLEMPSAAGIEVLADLGVVASVQPGFDARWGGPEGMYVQRLGAERAAPMNPFAALHAAGVALALGSDAPVTPLDPWGTLRAAVHHRTPGSGLPAEVAFDAHTRGGHHAARSDGGVLAVGEPATFAVWETDRPLLDLEGPDPVCRLLVVRGAA